MAARSTSSHDRLCSILIVRVLFLTAGLQIGGAEHQLKLIAESMVGLGAEPQILAMTSGGPLADAYRECALDVHELPMEGFRGVQRNFRKLADAIDRARPDIIQGWMYRGNLAAALAKVVRRSSVPITWGIRDGAPWRIAVRPGRLGPLLLSTGIGSLPRAIVYNSSRSRREHEAIGFPRSKGFIIPNIVDAGRWAAAAQVRHATRQRLALAQETPVIGLVARWHKKKGHGLFLSAIELLACRRPEARFILVGAGTDKNNAALVTATERLSCRSKILLLGPRTDIAEVTAALDVACCCSIAEGSPNSVAEALLAGVPVVSTDVGNAPELVGGFGTIVSSRDPSQFAAACEQWMDLEPHKRSALAATHAVRHAKHASAEDIARQYLTLYRGLVEGTTARLADASNLI